MIKHNRNQLIQTYMKEDSLTYEEAVEEVDKYLAKMKRLEELAKKNPLRKFTTYAGEFTITDDNGDVIYPKK